ncbi:hypothetical protein BX666DRAFT_1952069, partial [Dichotomocladium elegans]
MYMANERYGLFYGKRTAGSLVLFTLCKTSASSSSVKLARFTRDTYYHCLLLGCSVCCRQQQLVATTKVHQKWL